MFTASANRLTRTLVSSLVIWMIPFLSRYAVRSAYRAWHSASLASYQAKSASDTRMGLCITPQLPNQSNRRLLATLLYHPAADQAVDGDPGPPLRRRGTLRGIYPAVA